MLYNYKYICCGNSGKTNSRKQGVQDSATDTQTYTARLGRNQSVILTDIQTQHNDQCWECEWGGQTHIDLPWGVLYISLTPVQLPFVSKRPSLMRRERRWQLLLWWQTMCQIWWIIQSHRWGKQMRKCGCSLWSIHPAVPHYKERVRPIKRKSLQNVISIFQSGVWYLPTHYEC